MKKGMFKTQAVYRESLAYEGNPLVEALPEQLMLPELYSALYSKPKLPEDCMSYSPAERIALTSKNVYNTYIPMDYAAQIYLSIYRGMRSAYDGREQRDIVRQLTKIGAAIEARDAKQIPDCGVQAQSFSVIGDAGMGKSATIRKILRLFPQVIEHTEYKGMPFHHVQVPYICIECPGQDSPRGACIQILEEMDHVLGTNMSAEEARKTSNVDMLIARIAAVCLRYSIGVLVIDEVQNIIASHSKDPECSSKVIRFLVELSNKTGVCLLCVGMPRVGPFFDREPHLMGRTRGPRIKHMENGKTFYALCKEMLDELPLANRPQLTKEMVDVIYKYSGGVIRNMQRLIVETCEVAISTCSETITPELLKRIGNTINLDKDKKNQLITGIEIQFMLSTNGKPITSATEKISKELKNETRVARGRPRECRDENDLLCIYDDCNKRRLDIVKKMLMLNIAEELER